MGINITTRDRVVALLNQYGPQSKDGLLEKLGDQGKAITHRHLQRLLHDLIETGHVKRIAPKKSGGDPRQKNVYSLAHLPGELDPEGKPMGTAEQLEAFKSWEEEGLLKSFIPWLRERGYNIQRQTEPDYTKEFISTPLNFSGDTLKVGVISDTHLGSKFQQLSHLEALYDIFEAEGVEHVLHAGDLMDGGNIFRNQQFELFTHGPQEQIEYCEKFYPKRPGMTTHLIAGNHDLGWGGLDANALVSRLRSDFNYLGTWLRPIDVAGVTFMLHHGARGPTKALSGRVQQAIDSWVGEGNECDYYIQGHFHKTATVEDYRGVMGIMPGCFQATTPYIRRLAGHADIGGSIVSTRLSQDDEILSKGREWFGGRRVFPEMEHDY